jgi:hypothetical protein
MRKTKAAAFEYCLDYSSGRLKCTVVAFTRPFTAKLESFVAVPQLATSGLVQIYSQL